MTSSPPLILASGSAARAALLRQAGLAFTIEAVALDESALKGVMRAEGINAGAAAATLALRKAEPVSRRHPEALVIGADQILVCDERWYDKPRDRAAGEAQLRRLRGREHQLPTAVVVVEAGLRRWGRIETPRLTMRPFSDAALSAHLDAIGDAITATVGGYMLEGAGVGLFERIEGDYFSILGLPLLALLGFLRRRQVIAG